MASGDDQDEQNLSMQRGRPSIRERLESTSTQTTAQTWRSLSGVNAGEIEDAQIATPVRARPTFTQRLCNEDGRKFRKYVESTTTHGIVRVFTGKSRVRRLFWAVIFLTATGLCLGNIGERIRFLAGDPTSTTVSQKYNRNGILFPAVTVCNLNLFKKSVVEHFVEFSELRALTELLTNPLSNQVCSNITTFSDNLYTVTDGNFSLRFIQDVARHRAEDMIINCTYAGEECSHNDFTEILTHLGYCYTFNGRDQPILKSRGIGTRYGLSLMLNIEQDEYLVPLRADAGIKISIHSQDQPPAPDDIGVAIPPGRNAFIGIRQRNVTDSSTRSRKEGSCREADDTSSFNFLQERFEYSTTACLVDCFFSNITEECGCIETSINVPPPSSRYNGLRDCSPADFCCVLYYYNRAHPCDCPAACKYMTYDISTSYSAFPASNLAATYANNFNTTTDYITNNLLQVNIFYESQNTEVEVTVNAYSPTALLSDIGGLLGLFIGASVISMLECGAWILDEFKDRCLGLNDRKLEEWYEAAQKDLEELDKKMQQKQQ